MSVEVSELVVPRHGVVTLFGYGISVKVKRGHLILDDGIGENRRRAQLPRVGHGLKRLVIVGSDGMVSLSALRWLADQDATFAMLDRDGSVLATTGPVRSSDSKLRRAQALAPSSGAGLTIASELIIRKLAGQEQVARKKLLNTVIADRIAEFRAELPESETITSVRLIESQAAAAYWSAWRSLAVNFPRNDIPRVPKHWLSFGTRVSSLTGSPRLATNPVNAILNYLYAVLESEACIAISATGCDPGLGVLHVDSGGRNSLALDVLEVVRPQVDSYVLDWFTRQHLRREWFFEQRNGNCRLMGSFAVRLSETAPTWRRALAPLAEWVAHTFWSTIAKPDRPLGTPLTQRRKREAKGHSSFPPEERTPNPQRVCSICGNVVSRSRTYCSKCEVEAARERMANVAKVGRIASQAAGPQACRADTQRRHLLAINSWNPTSLPAWLTETVYTSEIQPRLSEVGNPIIMSTLGVSVSYAVAIRAGRRIPHRRHWVTLAKTVGISG